MHNGSPLGVGMFDHAEGVSISDTNFNINSPTSILNVIKSSGIVLASPIDQLREHGALKAILDSNERFNAPRCEPETREAIIQEILEWINDGPRFATMLWLHGSAGVGKSAIAQTVAEFCRRTGKYGGSFFFSRTQVDSGRHDGDRVLPTLAYQLAQRIPTLMDLLKEIIERDQGIFLYSRALQMERLFVQPLLLLQAQGGKPKSFRRFFGLGSSKKSSILEPCLVVIDGLDECSDPNIQTDLLRLFAAAVARLQLPIRFLISSRPETHIVQTFKREVNIPVHLLNLSQDRNVNNDIRLFLNRRFESIRHFHPVGRFLSHRWPEAHIIDTLVERSSEHFIYPSIAMKYLESSQHHPVDRLNIILNLLPPPVGDDNPFDPLDSLYRHIFSAIPKHHLPQVLHLLGLIHVESQSNISKWIFGLFPIALDALGGDSPYAYSKRVLIERILELRPGELDLILSPVVSIVDFEDEIKVLHASVFDFLCDATRAREFYLDLSEVHAAVVGYFIKEEHRFAFYTTGPHGRRAAYPVYIFQHLEFFIYHLSKIREPLSPAVSSYLESFNLLYNIVLSTEVLERSFRSDADSYQAEVLQLLSSLGLFFEWLQTRSLVANANMKHLKYHTKRIESILLSHRGGAPRASRPLPFQNDSEVLYRYQYAVFRILESFNSAPQSSAASGRSRTSKLPLWVLSSPWGGPDQWRTIPKGVLRAMKFYLLAWFSHTRRPGATTIREALTKIESDNDLLDIELDKQITRTLKRGTGENVVHDARPRTIPQGAIRYTQASLRPIAVYRP